MSKSQFKAITITRTVLYIKTVHAKGLGIDDSVKCHNLILFEFQIVLRTVIWNTLK